MPANSSRPFLRSPAPPSQTGSCIDACGTCARVCLETLAEHCLPSQDHHARALEARLLLDCATICRACADFLCRKSDHQAVICLACAEICDACAQACAESEDGAMRICEATCSACAVLCRNLMATERT